MDTKDKIVQFLRDAEVPQTLQNIAGATNVSMAGASVLLKKLVEQQKVLRIETNRNIYYTVNREATFGDVANMHNEIAKETVKAKDNYEELKEDMEQIRENVNSIYVNIISVMSIFVAIFALITVNANIAFELTTQNMYDVFWGIIKINIFVAICIIVLLIGVRVIIINPLLGKNKKDDKNLERG